MLILLVTAMFVLLFSFTALVFTMCLVTVSDIGIVTVFCLMFIQVMRVEMCIMCETFGVYSIIIASILSEIKCSLN